ncbi:MULTISPECIES: hypothetical protein [Halomonadaceae]|nr:hypothetical protein [Halomonas sp. MES3-P3E]
MNGRDPNFWHGLLDFFAHHFGGHAYVHDGLYSWCSPRAVA